MRDHNESCTNSNIPIAMRREAARTLKRSQGERLFSPWQEHFYPGG
jgi:hypothetical protein